MKKIINKKNALKDLSEQEFEELLPILATEIENHGIIYETYSDEEILNNISLTRSS